MIIWDIDAYLIIIFNYLVSLFDNYLYLFDDQLFDDYLASIIWDYSMLIRDLFDVLLFALFTIIWWLFGMNYLRLFNAYLWVFDVQLFGLFVISLFIVITWKSCWSACKLQFQK